LRQTTITLRYEEWDVPHTVEFSGSRLVPLRAGEKMGWRRI
jgi:dihydroorotase